MDRYPTEQDEMVAQFCAMTGVQASDVNIKAPTLDLNLFTVTDRCALI
jgi:hypothetical protein